MMDIVNEWCNGASFLNICKMTDMFEGSIIRSMRLLEELLRQMVQAAKNIGEVELENVPLRKDALSFLQGLELKRGLVGHIRHLCRPSFIQAEFQVQAEFHTGGCLYVLLYQKVMKIKRLMM